MHSVVEEADGCHITNQGMLLQLKGLTEGFYLGYYMLDNIKFQPPEEESIKDEDERVRNCFSHIFFIKEDDLKIGELLLNSKASQGKTEDVPKFGTTQPIRVKRLSEEDDWYYFKALAFGIMDPDEHPKLASLAMQLCHARGPGWNAENLIIRKRGGQVAQKHLSSSGVHPDYLFERNTPVDFSRIAFVDGQVQGFLVYDVRVASPAEGQLPKLTS
ncbi:Os11g0160800 [Oryza sativa Japonica Group]|uniref:Os11g0160800 protein n=1 Tax=Oryza sativa subsp. japonica TaxID=39947 RepID=A0A0P0XZG9_ORYSJ|nr:Os11g0160800 [Oryza sativa Japonica Group]